MLFEHFHFLYCANKIQLRPLYSEVIKRLNTASDETSSLNYRQHVFSLANGFCKSSIFSSQNQETCQLSGEEMNSFCWFWSQLLPEAPPLTIVAERATIWLGHHMGLTAYPGGMLAQMA